jgi:hypothetical protein
MEDFPANSQGARKAPREEPESKIAESPKFEKVIAGGVVRRKKPLGKRMKDAFFGGDGPTVREQLIEDIILPNLRDLIIDVVNGGVERMVRGESRASYRRGGNTRFGAVTGRINYNGISQSPVGRGMRDDSRVPLSRRARAAHDFEEIILDSRAEGEMVLSSMFDALERYEQVTVAELLELLGITSNFTEMRYGWTDLRGSRVDHVRGGYLLNLPRPELLER